MAGYERDENAPPSMRGNGKVAKKAGKASPQRTSGKTGKQARARA